MLEALIASLLMAITMIPLLQFSLTTIWANDRAQKMSLPLALAREKIEELMSLSSDNPILADDGDVEDILYYPGHPDQEAKEADHPLEEEVTNLVEDPINGGMVEGISHPGISGEQEDTFFRVWNIVRDVDTGRIVVNVIVYWYDGATPHRTQLSTIVR